MVDFSKIEKKWQKAWAEAKLFEVKQSKKKKFYVLEMFPYPSGSGLHVGHALNYTIGDVYARFKRLNGFNVLHPMGYDSLGLPAENAAIKHKTHPKDYTEASIKNFIKQQQLLGLTYDWSRKLNTSDPNYYKWDQWIFLQMYKKGLAYKKKSPVNWCPKCNTVLANEQVHNGKCWRHEQTDVEIKNLSQWFLKTTDYVEELNDFSKLGQWPNLIKKLQKNWIGKSHGTNIKFKINNEDWSVFTTRPDTLFGVTFLVISAQHSKLMGLVTKEQESKVKAFLKKLNSVSEGDINQLEKEGVFTGSYAEHPFTQEKIPIYAGNFVLAEYGSGMVMAVPAHDQRDFEFAKKYKIQFKEVIHSKEGIKEKAYTGDGTLINSGKFNNLNNRAAIKEITNELKKINKGGPTINYKLRDWLISRQRYWGTPIPIINCQKCGEQPVPEKDLPVKLPKDVKFGKGNPLTTNNSFISTICPKCGQPATRETDTMDTFVNSSWYQLRYTDPNNDKEIFNKEKANYWNPVDMYIGGKEHACMHLMYIRFYTKFLRDIGLLKFDEPAIRLFNQGMLHAEDGNKMSKSLGNTVNPLDIIKEKGADSLRLFLVSVAAPDSDFNWDDKGVTSTNKFLNKVYEYFQTIKPSKSSEKTESKLNKSILLITEDLENLRYNLAIIKLRELFESFKEQESKQTLESFLILLNPFCPHLTEELWQKLGNKPFISAANWPLADKAKINEDFEVIDNMLKILSTDIKHIQKLANKTQISKIRLFISNKWKYQLYNILKKELKNTRNPKEIIGKVMSSDIKQHSKDIMKIIPKIIKANCVPYYLSLNKEQKALEESLKEIEKEFNCKVELILADKSSENKANQALPGKPAILIE